MHNKLEMILKEKILEVSALKNNRPAHAFKAALKLPTIIAEIKRRSPSKGELAAIQHPLVLADQYKAGGARAISILTDKHFAGSIADLKQIAESDINLPILRKDFIIDKIQIAEAYFAGAQAVLLIVAVLKEQTQAFIAYAHSLQMDALVEVHDEAELALALDSGAEIIGINNRNLTTFQVEPKQALNLAKYIPTRIIKIAESGITHPDQARAYFQAGFHGVLIGEALVKSNDPAQFIRACYE